MKKITLITAAIIAYCLLHTAYCFSQGTAINSSGAAADNSAMLDVSSTSKGMLVPRMLKAEKLAIANPANGLLIYQINDTTGFWYFNGTKWVQAIGPAGSGGGSCSYTIGQSYGGGNIFYIDASGCHGLIAATSDQSTAAKWSDINEYSGAYSTFGNVNTEGIILQGATTGAAYICNNLTLNGYSDWFLPSLEEMVTMYIRKAYIGGLSNDHFYWSSKESDSVRGWRLYIGTMYGGPYSDDKYKQYYVRCIRQF